MNSKSTKNDPKLFAGVDVGAATAKAVIIGDNGILGYAVRSTGHDVKIAADAVMQEALEKSGLDVDVSDLAYIVSTGYARRTLQFAHKPITEIICHAKGANFLFPDCHFIIDMGGQDSKAIEVDDEGNVVNFVMNDKCAAGTGRFLEVMAHVLDVEDIADMGPLALSSRHPCSISSTCTVFAETEVVVLRGAGKDRADLIAGVHRAVSSRVAVMAKALTIRPEAVFTGGVAKNAAVKKFLEEAIGMELHVPEEPQIVGALGAALLAREEATRLPAVETIESELPHR
ncbi:MAG: 2-hydroxyglutaryl-CoA dehydratase [Actinobacteria bacterium]|nr:2-hydroxyglutaryl-CoA dehydratase [Actinomycetota bacterium]